MIKHLLPGAADSLLLLWTLIFTGCHPRQNPTAPVRGKPATTETMTLSIRGRKIVAEVARTPEKRAQGLMFRSTLSPDSGMFFIFDRDEPLRFWMKNCYIPLSIAFIDSQGIITDILEMAPLDTTTIYCSSKPVRYALEAVAGWFTFNQIKPGDTVHGFR